MPNRIIRDGINSSDKVNQLDWPAEVFFRRLMSVVDDFGLFDGRASVLRAACYPLKLDKVREADIERWMAECLKAGLIVLYESDGKSYVWLLNLGKPRAEHSKYPFPPREIICAHKSAYAPVFDCALRISYSDSGDAKKNEVVPRESAGKARIKQMLKEEIRDKG